MMKTSMLACAAIMALHGAAFAGGDGWSSDFAAVKKQAAESKKDILIDFTGSDWCSWCVKLNDEVFKQDAFKAGVKDSFVLLQLDFPKDKSKLSEETQKQNETLRDQYAIQGFPTIMLCDATGKPFAATGYEPGGPEKYVELLNELRGHKTKRDEAFATAAKAEGLEKAKALIAALDAMHLDDVTVANFYGDIAAQITAADTKDETGFAKKVTEKKKFAELQTQLQGFGMKQDHEGALGAVDKALKDGGFSKDDTQQVMMIRASILAVQNKFDDALKAIDDAKKFFPESPVVAQIEMFRKQLEHQKNLKSGAAGKGNAAEEDADDADEDEDEEVK